MATYYNAVTATSRGARGDLPHRGRLSEDGCRHRSYLQGGLRQRAAAAAHSSSSPSGGGTAAAGSRCRDASAGARSRADRRVRMRRAPNTADWACIRQHESNDNYAEGNGGAYQFELGTWSALTGLPSPAEDYPPAVQDAAALKLYPSAAGSPGPPATSAGCEDRHRRDAPAAGRLETKRTPTPKHTTAKGCTQPAAHPAATNQPERTMPSRSPFGARMQWPEPAYTEQSLARRARPTKGGAVRIRIALATAVAVIVVAVPAVLITMFSSGPRLGAGDPPRGGGSHQGAERPGRAHRRQVDVVLPGAQGRTGRHLRQQRRGGPGRRTFYKWPTSRSGRQARRKHHPGRMDADSDVRRGRARRPDAGYFGILEWNGFDGYPTAGSAPSSVQLAWEAAYTGPARRTGRVPQLLRQRSTLPRRAARYPASKMAVTCAMSK